jgi:hypothetical protein
MRWFFLNAIEIGLIGIGGVLYLLATEVQVLHTPVRLLLVALAVWLVFSVLGDVFQRIPGALKLLAEQQEVKARYLQNIITSIALRCIAIAAFATAIRVAP